MELLNSLLNVLYSLVELLSAVAHTAAPWIPLFAWIAFWTLAVDWTRLAPILARGGMIGLLLIAFMAVLVWSVVAPPPDGVHHLFGLAVGNWTGKLMYVTVLVVIAFLCGSVQLSGTVQPWVKFDQVADEDSHGDHLAADERLAHDAHGH